ncbi:glycosyltransferase family 8 protein [Levilactobacillus tujiorum]|uniref:Glycosyltransferase family 8 protein n=1 Tax=Levilactobacillus tujiorum TaxID=2912243 RepID=A0ABX1L731_9LACO|nr:glycosyltransferase family 8 protein [Levilactobacillus tujiorum]NLR11822.1 glycosyltransferase family 8 protein [Lactobacillus sp. HBUAS51387]NLR29677.1 glycosyltransferase family 8 protein [Levilactobacillus tujiorum]
MTDEINLLVTLNSGYVEPLKTMLYSVYVNNPDEHIHLWLLHASLTATEVAAIQQLTTAFGWTLSNEKVATDFAAGVPLIKRYPREMYFRLLSGQILPTTVKRVIYLDPDLLVINALRPLWEIDLQGHMLAAAVHRGVTGIVDSVNQLRLGTKTSYFNSGVLVMDLEQARAKIKLADITTAIDQHESELILPDQDILNFLYGADILEIPEEIWNYDTRKYLSYQTRSLNQHDIHWVMAHTVILHYCGTPKPWEAASDSKFTSLFLYHQQQLQRFMPTLARDPVE